MKAAVVSRQGQSLPLPWQFKVMGLGIVRLYLGGGWGWGWGWDEGAHAGEEVGGSSMCVEAGIWRVDRRECDACRRSQGAGVWDLVGGQAYTPRGKLDG